MFTSRKGALLTFVVLSMVAMGILLCSPAAAGSSNSFPTAQPSPGAAHKYEYKGIWIGMAADTVRTKLGNPKDKADTQDMYVFSENESVLFYYDGGHQVSAIMVTFSGDLKGAPAIKDVFGEDVPAKPDGSIFKMERYPKEGYWMSYNRTAGADAAIMIAVQKI
jgi:hypothetical protein